MVAAAIVGSAVVGGVTTAVGSKRASESVEAGAASAAQATIEATMLQIAEIQRQFNYQQQILFPQIQNQYAGQRAVMDLLGLGGGAGSATTELGGQPLGRDFETELSDIDQQIAELRDAPAQYGGGGTTQFGGGGGGMYGYVVGARQQQEQLRELEAQREQIVQQQTAFQAGGDLEAPPFPGPGATQFTRGDRGQIIDPNLDPTRMADINTLPEQVRQNLLAGTSYEEDPYAAAVGGRRLQEGAAGTGVYGNVFQESPGYAFQVEEVERQLDRVGSAGGNYGGRAIIEAQRRAQGLASGEYYNWAAGRERDLGRLGGAEQFDIARDDEAMYNYLGRRAGDVSRLDFAAQQEDQLLGADIARGDQSYYNLLSQFFNVAGFGDPSSRAVSSSQAAGGAVAGAYGQQGGQLANIYNTAGVNQAQIGLGATANYNNIFQSMIENLITAGTFGET